MILVAPFPQLQTRFREDVQRPDGQGGTVTVTREVGTGAKDDQGNVRNDARLTLFGEPRVEREGVAHAWTDDEIRWLEDEFIPSFPAAFDSVYLTDSIPDDVRDPEEV